MPVRDNCPVAYIDKTCHLELKIALTSSSSASGYLGEETILYSDLTVHIGFTSLLECKN